MQTVKKKGHKIVQMTVREYAEQMGVTTQAVTYRCREGRLEQGVTAKKMGREYLIERVIH